MGLGLPAHGIPQPSRCNERKGSASRREILASGGKAGLAPSVGFKGIATLSAAPSLAAISLMIDLASSGDNPYSHLRALPAGNQGSSELRRFLSACIVSKENPGLAVPEGAAHENENEKAIGRN